MGVLVVKRRKFGKRGHRKSRYYISEYYNGTWRTFWKHYSYHDAMRTVQTIQHWRRERDLYAAFHPEKYY